MDIQYLDTGTQPRISSQIFPVRWLPLIQIAPLKWNFKLDHYDAILVSSKQAIEILMAHNCIPHQAIFAIGKNTAQYCSNKGLVVEEIGNGDLQSLLQLLQKRSYQGQVLHPCSSETRLNTHILSQYDLHIENQPIYEPILHPEFEKTLLSEPELLGTLRGNFYFSGSAVRALLKCTQIKQYLPKWKHFACGQSAWEELKQQSFQLTQLCGAQGPQNLSELDGDANVFME